MAEIVNLRTRRKQARRVAERAAATENAARHGQSKAETRLLAARAEAETRRLDGHLLEGKEPATQTPD